MSVVCSNFPFVEIVRAVGGERVQVEWFVEAGQPVFNFRPSESQLSRWRAADLVVAAGQAEPWAIEGVADPYRAQGVVLVDSLPAAGGQPLQRYFWLDFEVARELVVLLRDRLTVLEMRSESFFRDNAEAYLERIDQMEREYAPRLEVLRGRKVLALHGRWAPLAQAVGLEVVQPVTSAAHDLTSRDYAALRQAVQAHELQVVLLESDTAPAVVREVQERLGVRAVLLDPLGTSAPAGRNGYLAIMRYNLEQLVEGLD